MPYSLFLVNILYNLNLDVFCAATLVTSITDGDAALSFVPAVTALSLKLLPYWPTDPEVWFAPVQAQSTTTRGISTQKMMFD